MATVEAAGSRIRRFASRFACFSAAARTMPTCRRALRSREVLRAAVALIVVTCCSTGVSAQVHPCNGLGRRYCAKSHLARECPKTCMPENCRGRRRIGFRRCDDKEDEETCIDYKWDQIAEQGLYTFGYVNRMWTCLATCRDEPDAMRCLNDDYGQYDGRRYCRMLDCTRARSDGAISGCHQPRDFHRPTCYECSIVFAAGCSSLYTEADLNSSVPGAAEKREGYRPFRPTAASPPSQSAPRNIPPPITLDEQAEQAQDEELATIPTASARDDSHGSAIVETVDAGVTSCDGLARDGIEECGREIDKVDEYHTNATSIEQTSSQAPSKSESGAEANGVLGIVDPGDVALSVSAPVEMPEYYYEYDDYFDFDEEDYAAFYNELTPVAAAPLDASSHTVLEGGHGTVAVVEASVQVRSSGSTKELSDEESHILVSAISTVAGVTKEDVFIQWATTASQNMMSEGILTVYTYLASSDPEETLERVELADRDGRLKAEMGLEGLEYLEMSLSSRIVVVPEELVETSTSGTGSKDRSTIIIAVVIAASLASIGIVIVEAWHLCNRYRRREVALGISVHGDRDEDLSCAWVDVAARIAEKEESMRDSQLAVDAVDEELIGSSTRSSLLADGNSSTYEEGAVTGSEANVAEAAIALRFEGPRSSSSLPLSNIDDEEDNNLPDIPKISAVIHHVTQGHFTRQQHRFC